MAHVLFFVFLWRLRRRFCGGAALFLRVCGAMFLWCLFGGVVVCIFVVVVLCLCGCILFVQVVLFCGALLKFGMVFLLWWWPVAVMFWYCCFGVCVVVYYVLMFLVGCLIWWCFFLQIKFAVVVTLWLRFCVGVLRLCFWNFCGSVVAFLW